MATLPAETLTGVWLPLIVVGVLAFLFSIMYSRRYQRRRDAECSTTVVIVLSLTVALLTLAVIPVDIFTVSSFKNSNGMFESWAANDSSRKSVEDAFLYTYYTIYGLVMAFTFLFLPFVYFYYEEGDDDTTTGKRICSALKYWIVFVIVGAVLMIIGAFVPWSESTPSNSSKSPVNEAELFLGSLKANGGENAVSFTISVLVFIGMICLALYTSVGMAALPVDLIRGYQDFGDESKGLLKTKKRHGSARDDLRARYADGKNMAKKDRRSKEYLEVQERMLKRRERKLRTVSKSWKHKCSKFWQPVSIIIGIVLVLLALLVFISLLLNNIDRAVHGLGYHYGFMLQKSTLPSPIGKLLFLTQPFFPLDYVIMVLIIVFLVVVTIYGVQRIGIWCFCMRMYRVRPHRTATQGLMFMSFIVMLVVLSLGVILMSIAPDYVRYGNQKYNTKCLPGSQHNVSSYVSQHNVSSYVSQHNVSSYVSQHNVSSYVSQHNVSSYVSQHNVSSCVQCDGHCSLSEPTKFCDADVTNCAQTRIAILISRFCYKMWFFGVGYYACEWLFLAVYLLALTVVLCRKKRSNIHNELHSSDTESSNEEV